MARVEVLSQRRLNRATLARQMLLQRADVTSVTAVARLAGMQAQEPRPPFVGLWSRLHDLQRESLHGALHDRELVRGTLMRGTLHLFAAADYTAFRQTLQPVLNQGLRALGARAAGLETDAVIATARGLLAEQPRTFQELRCLLREAFPAVDERALGLTVRMLAPLVMIPTHDRWSFPANARFGLAEEWLGAPPRAEDATTELLRRYLAAFGPASAADAQTWSGLPKLKPVFARMRPELAVFQDERGRELFDLPDAPRPDAGTPAPVRFLPEFDNLLLSHADRTRVIADEHRNLVYQKGNLRLLASFLVDGVVAGTWRAERQGKAATLWLKPFAPLPQPARAALAEEGERLLRFVEEDAASYAVACAT